MPKLTLWQCLSLALFQVRTARSEFRGSVMEANTTPHIEPAALASATDTIPEQSLAPESMIRRALYKPYQG